MFPLFWWSDLYSLLLQPCWLQPPIRCSIYLRWTSLYVAHTLSILIGHIASNTNMSYYSNIWTHLEYLPPICGQKAGHCISRFHRSPSASMAFCAWQLQQLRRGNAYWVAFCCLTKGTWEVDQQSMGRNLQTWRCGVIWYNTTNGKRMPNKRGQ